MKTKHFPMVLAVIAALVAVSSCGGQKKAAVDGKTEIIMPFNTPVDMSDMEYFRATASGTSPDQEMARTIADLNARTQLGTQISTVVKAVTERYMNQVNVADKAEFAQKVEQNVRIVVNQELSGAVVKGTKLYQAKDGSYECWINIEMPRSKVTGALEDAITKDEKLALDFDQHLFMKTFDEEMARQMQGNQSR